MEKGRWNPVAILGLHVAGVSRDQRSRQEQGGEMNKKLFFICLVTFILVWAFFDVAPFFIDGWRGGSRIFYWLSEITGDPFIHYKIVRFFKG